MRLHPGLLLRGCCTIPFFGAAESRPGNARRVAPSRYFDSEKILIQQTGHAHDFLSLISRMAVRENCACGTDVQMHSRQLLSFSGTSTERDRFQH